MARPKHQMPSLFTGGELATATAISARNIQFLRDKRLGPFARIDQAGGMYGEDTLAELAMISGCMKAGYPLSLSASLVDAFLSENPNHTSARFCSVDKFDHTVSLSGESWFHRHTLLRESHELTSPHDEDGTLIIADREYVLTHSKGKPKIPMLANDGVDPYGPQPLGRMLDLVRGADTRFFPFAEEFVGWSKDSDGQQILSVATVQAEIAFQRAAKDAIALVTVNLSLAIRRAFDAVYVARKAKGGPLWAEESE